MPKKQKQKVKTTPNNPSDFRDYKPRQLTPRSEKQHDYIQAIRHDPVVFAIGSAGTGKTFIPSFIAADLYMQKKIKKIIITRPNVECGDKMGALPGTVEEKFEPWTLPIVEAMQLVIPKGKWECDTKSKKIEQIPLQLMRGRTFDDAFIICDEAQNATREQLMMLTTRIGENSTLVISGDTRQSDVRNSGLTWLVDLIRKYQKRYEIIDFTLKDCVRSEVCKDFLEMFERAS